MLLSQNVIIAEVDESDEDDNEEQPELDKQMGDLGEEADKLDEQIWGSHEEQDEEESNVCNRPLQVLFFVAHICKVSLKRSFL